jgi:hypothetical protein
MSPDRLLWGNIDRIKLIYTSGELLGSTFAAVYFAALGPARLGPIPTWQVAIALWIVNVGLAVLYLSYLKRMGRRGGYYTHVHARAIREQVRYRRSAYPAAPLRPVRDQQRF